MPTDEDLMLRSAEGDMDAFEQLVRRHEQTALNVAYRFLGDRDLAEDTAQEAFLKILSRAASYRPTARFSTYLYNVVWHLCVDTYRRKRAGSLEGMAELRGRGGEPISGLLADERQDRVRAAVDTLPPRQRMALVLKHFEDMSYEDIAGVLECSPAAVDSLLIRARRKLKDLLADLM
jgi:RNA polymerase sigma-70 factor (ECF subfamily)